MGKRIHEHVLEMGFGSDLYIGNALIDMYARFGDLDKARNVFEEMAHRDIVSWNSLISGYSSNGYWEEALEIYDRSRMDGVVPDSFTISSVLPACGGSIAVQEGQLIHGLVEKIGIHADVIVANGLLSIYFKFDRVSDASKIFDQMVVRDCVSWKTVICGYGQSGMFGESIKLFMEMVNVFQPDLLTITSTLRSCVHLRNMEFGRYIHDYMVRSKVEFDITASNILIDMYAKCGNLVASQEVFDKMKCRDSISWNSLINGYIINAYYDKGLMLFKMMKMEMKPDAVSYLMLLSISTKLADKGPGKMIHCDLAKLGFDSDIVVANALIDMYAKCGMMEHSLKVFEKMKARDIVTWNTIIAACVHSENCRVGLKMTSQMRDEGVSPDVASMLGILPMCSLLAAKRQGKEIHGCILRFGFELHVPIGNALIEMYSKCGRLKDSIRVFKCMKMKDVVTWTALISAYGMYGEGRKAFRAFLEMEATGICPDHVAFVAILFACSHSGLVDEGLSCFDRMMKDYNIEPRIEHYGCVVDLLSRSGCLTEAEEFILSMPLRPDASIWGSLLSACHARGDIKVAERVSEEIIKLTSVDTGYYVLVSNLYAALAKWDQVRMIRKSLKAKGRKKQPGCSWMEIHNMVYVFGTGDKSFEQYEEVYKLLGVLAGLLAKEGYVADLRFVLHDVEDDEKRDLLCGHSERLAIAFGLLNTKPGTTLQVMKNLRVCGDCHTVTKYISKITQREILVRDANRFHLFKDGLEFAEAKLGANKRELLPKEFSAVIDVSGFLSEDQEDIIKTEIKKPNFNLVGVGFAEAKVGVNKPELLPKEFSPVIDVAGFLSDGQEKRLIQEIGDIETDTGFKLRVLAQNYPETPVISTFTIQLGQPMIIEIQSANALVCSLKNLREEFSLNSFKHLSINVTGYETDVQRHFLRSGKERIVDPQPSSSTASQHTAVMSTSNKNLWKDEQRVSRLIELAMTEFNSRRVTNGKLGVANYEYIALIMKVDVPCLDTQKIKTKIENLRNEHRAFNNLRNRTGFGWDPTTQTVIADVPQWNECYVIPLTQGDKTLSCFMGKGLDHYDELVYMFGNTTSNGSCGVHLLKALQWKRKSDVSTLLSALVYAIDPPLEVEVAAKAVDHIIESSAFRQAFLRIPVEQRRHYVLHMK
ncbi:hypothetical protein CJ030_MR2G011706 [Morella rubra]|uniref:DYW domain-containing protein n=1 Tax=Morella rubra TaxID=262757 RepID=A0A6A1WEP8_9ROSI|nr:hypothetical protein CJ030_MR2G011726 [Morella rubra]KAB1223681.1 hypothetical protein CJ030_MR2G011706 [Morella rubra]